MKVLTVVGARPQFVKAGPVSRALRKEADEVLVHTGQHYDQNMSEIFFSELDIPHPDYNLGVGSGTHGQQTAQMLVGIEEVAVNEHPDWLLVYGDTNSTLAGALAAAKLHIPIAHVEAGLRSFNRLMPEEVNRVLTDHMSTLLLAPTRTAVDNLAKEGIVSGVLETGDVMVDSLLFALNRSKDPTLILDRYQVVSKGYILSTIHRAENTGSAEQVLSVLRCLNEDGRPVVLPVHPRTRGLLKEWVPGLNKLGNIRFIDPVGLIDMVMLEKHADVIVTDSGGVQKEAYILGTRCVTLRNETEWVETLADGWNDTVGFQVERLFEALARPRPAIPPRSAFGDGHAADSIVKALIQHG